MGKHAKVKDFLNIGPVFAARCLQILQYESTQVKVITKCSIGTEQFGRESILETTYMKDVCYFSM